MEMLHELLFNTFNFACLYYEKESCYLEEFKKAQETFKSKLNDELIKEFKHLMQLFESHLLSIRDEECKDVMYSCLKIGMECQEYLDKRH